MSWRSAAAHALSWLMKRKVNDLNSEGGVYALIMHMIYERTIQIGKMGTFTFEPGWYIYIGSAHGPGGLKARTDRHRQDGERKRKKWNVDYVRPFAPISEIWFSHAARYREHNWAWTAMRMFGATIPVAKFGANDCYPRCRAHFFRFDSRPFLAEFRADLLNRWPDHPTIYTEFVEPATSDPPCLQSLPTLLEYDQGRRLLELMRRAAYDGISNDGNGKSDLSFAVGTLGRDLAEQLAPAMRISVEELIAAAKFGDAVDTLYKNCDEDVFRALFHPIHPQSRKAVLELSRTADTRQRYRIDGVLEGRFRSVAPQNSDPVYDTVSFKEIPSRLARARGSLQQLDGLLTSGVEVDIAGELQSLFILSLATVKQLRRFIAEGNGADHEVAPRLSKASVWPVLMCRDVRGDLVGKARGALRLTIKNLWDYPEIQRREICALPAEREVALRELREIALLSKALLKILTKPRSTI